MVATADADEDGAAKASWIGYMESIAVLLMLHLILHLVTYGYGSKTYSE